MIRAKRFYFYTVESKIGGFVGINFMYSNKINADKARNRHIKKKCKVSEIQLVDAVLPENINKTTHWKCFECSKNVFCEVKQKNKPKNCLLMGVTAKWKKV